MLLVEDEQFDQILFTRAVQHVHADWDIECVPTLRQAIATLADDAIDLVVTDLTLPDATGAEALDAIGTAAPDVPLVVASGMDEDVLAEVLKGRNVAGVQRKGRLDIAALTAIVG